MHPAFLDNLSWEMAEVYGAITDQIMINLSRHFPYFQTGEPVPTSAFAYQAKMLAQMGQVNAETMRIIRNGLEDADLALQGALEQAIIDAVRTTEPELLDAVKKGILRPAGMPTVSPNQYRAFNLYYTQSADKLNLVNTVMLESTNSAYQQTITDVVSEIELAERINATYTALDVASGEVVTGVSSWNQALRHATDRMKNRGITGFIDHAGRHWSAEAYAAMDIRTTMFNTGRAAVWETNQNFGNDLYSVSYHNGARPLCYPYQNKVISATDNARTVVDLDGNEVEVLAQSATSYGQPAGLFGINCKHYPTPFIPGVSVIEGQPQDKEANDKTYAESQEQRRLERNVRERKRDVLMAKAQGAPPEEIKTLEAKAKASSEEVDEFCKATGRARHRDREAVYTKREFPGDGRYNVAEFKDTQQQIINNWYQQGGAQQNFTFGEMTPNEPIVPNPKSTPAATPTQPAPMPIVPQSSTAATQPLTIASASTKEELYKALENKYGVTIDDAVKKLDYKMVQEAMLGVQDITDVFPEVGDSLIEIATSKSGIMSCAGNVINFNHAYYTTPDRLNATINREVASGYWCKNTTGRSVGTHEAAHGLEWFLDTHNPAYTYSWDQINAWNHCTEAKAIVSQACKNIKKTPFGKGKLNAELIKSVSGYATKNASETLAEAFADVYANGNNASQMSLEVVKLTTAKYKQYGGTGIGK